MASDGADATGVLDRVTAILEAFVDGDDDGLGVSELARRAGLPKSTVSRIAADLVRRRYLDRVGDRLFLGLRLFELGQSVERPRALRHAAVPIATALRDATGLAVCIALVDGDDALVVASIRGIGGVAADLAIGERFSVGEVAEPEPSLAAALAAAIRAGAGSESVDPEAGVEHLAVPGLGVEGRAVAAIAVTRSAAAGSSDPIRAALREASVALQHRLAG
ncbi:helix-turn-helix domain-containing protein [Agromyces seonyuensis]|uniref:Helix-turn-helix domain-containing protein n=1 Tax=Agromyces seonyuensis TaxID=2662446 RepID=A0A6I4NS16_9MICO|nr:helix-turn-helix domain-containing protein [Agromyces seonyuensis]MWB97216.1 helix-turn-helix domain-containing protein [Agromyces seonyuensis]